MTINRFKLRIALFVIVSVLAASCDDDFYLSEKEFYALRGQLASANSANVAFGELRGKLLTIQFDNSVSPPRIRNSNLASFLRNGMPTLAILEGYPSYALNVERLSSEIETQLNNWLSTQIALYQNGNASARLERVESIRIIVRDNPRFAFSGGKIRFTVPIAMSVDTRIRIDALDLFTNFLSGGINGRYDFSVSMGEMALDGEMSFDERQTASNLYLRIAPNPGQVVVSDRGAPSQQLVKDRVGRFVKTILSGRLEENMLQKYDYFALRNCRIDDSFRCVYAELPDRRDVDVHTVVRGTDGRLYSAFRRKAIWSNFDRIDAERRVGRRKEVLAFSSDPAVAAISEREIEMAAVTNGGSVYLARFDGSWSSDGFIEHGGLRTTSARLRFTGKPAIVGSGVNTVDIVVARANGSLSHVRRNATGWSLPATVPLPGNRRYRNPAIVSSNQRLFLAAVGDDNRIYAIVYDMVTNLWSQSTQLSGSEPVKFAPAIVATDNRAIEMVYVGASGTPYQRTFHLGVENIRPGVGDSGTSFGPEISIGGNLTSTPALVKSDPKQLGLIARGTDNLLYYNHFTGPDSPRGDVFGRTIQPGWSGWGDLNRNFFGTALLAGGAAQDYSAVAGPGGRLELVAGLRANTLRTAFGLFHNSFDASTYGRQPWKTVHWRGFQKVGGPMIVGAPAICALTANRP